MTRGSWVVHKLGGSCLRRPESVAYAVQQLRTRPEPRAAVVVSAFAGVTDQLLRAVAEAGRGEAWRETVAEVARCQRRFLAAIPCRARRARLRAALSAELAGLAGRLADMGSGDVTEAAEEVSGLGEVWAARLLAAHLRQAGSSAVWLDARAYLTARPAAGGAEVDLGLSAALARRLDASGERFAVVTGFIAASPEGRPTTLGRNGTDYTATVVAALLGARWVELWKDVDGVLSADPRREPGARTLPRLSYAEAAALAARGVPVLHPRTVSPVEKLGIPILVRNGFAPERSGTWIGGVPEGAL